MQLSMLGLTVMAMQTGLLVVVHELLLQLVHARAAAAAVSHGKPMWHLTAALWCRLHPAHQPQPMHCPAHAAWVPPALPPCAEVWSWPQCAALRPQPARVLPAPLPAV